MLENYPIKEIKYEDLYKIKFSQSESIILTVYKDNVKYEFLIKVNSLSDKVLVMGSGAYDYEKYELPVFQRFTWINDFDCNVIYYNDPTLYLGNITIGWGYGSSKKYYLGEIARILTDITNIICIKNENIIFYGSSCGGFMSIVLSTLIKGSTAIVNNPQTDISKYYIVPVSRLFKSIYKNYDIKNIVENNLYRISVLETMRIESYIPKIIYLQNIACRFDMMNHLTPFIEGLQLLESICFKNNININLYYDNKQGHNPLSKKDTKNIINLVLENNDYSMVRFA